MYIKYMNILKIQIASTKIQKGKKLINLQKTNKLRVKIKTKIFSILKTIFSYAVKLSVKSLYS